MMQHTVLSALTLTGTILAMLAPAGLARGGDEWSKLDRDIEALASTASQTGAGPALSGLLRTAYVHLPNKSPFSPGGSQDLSGVTLLDAQVVLDGEVNEQYGYRLQLDGAGGTATLLDGYGYWNANQHVRFTMGRFRAPLAWESQLQDGTTLFLLRTDLGQLFYARDEGAMASGAFDRLHWALSAQNGSDSVADEQAFCARAGLDALGGGVGAQQGAYGADGESKLSVGAGYYNDQSIGSGNDGTIWVGDAQFRIGRFYADAMITDFGDGSTGVFQNRSGSTPWALAASWMLVENQWEVALRYQDTDNILNEADATLGVNYYVAGHDAKWQVNLDKITSDDPNIDDTWRFGLGLTVGI